MTLAARLGLGAVAALAGGAAVADETLPTVHDALRALPAGEALADHLVVAGLDARLRGDGRWIVLVPPPDAVESALRGLDADERRTRLADLLVRPAGGALRPGSVFATSAGNALVLDGPADAVRLGGARIADALVPARDGGIAPLDRFPAVERGLLATAAADRTEVIFPFTGDAAVADWYAVHDTVMGGRSSGGIRAAGGGHAVLTGDLSRENNGGFASVRTPVEAGRLDGASHLLLRVRGDGRPWEVRLRTSRNWNAAGWRATIETTAGEWTVVRVPVADFRPSWRGRALEMKAPLDPAAVLSLGLLVKDGDEGVFSLEVDWIAVERPAPVATPAGVAR